jgi:hypothetical protein
LAIVEQRTGVAGMLDLFQRVHDSLIGRKGLNQVFKSSSPSGCAIMSRLFSAGKREEKPVQAIE